MIRLKKIKTLQDIDSAIQAKKSLVCPDSPCFNRPIPAAVYMQFHGQDILRLIQKGLYIYNSHKEIVSQSEPAKEDAL